MSETGKLFYAVIGVFVVGGILVWSSKQDAKQESEQASMIRAYAAMQGMASKKCPAAITKATGETVYAAAKTDSDKQSYVTLHYQGEQKFTQASCTLRNDIGGISELIIDGKTLLKK
ncbi:MAG: hypothetical protein RQ715_02975 [Methylococcales bacterium]|nr:hypothetical protein [Methylococcales bacterium]